MSQSLDVDYIKASLDRIDTTTRNNHALLIERREAETQLLEYVKGLGDKLDCIQKADTLDRQQFAELMRDISRLIKILEKIDAVRSNLGSNY